MSEEYQDEQNPMDIQIETSKWVCDQADDLIKQYKNCKTEFARKKLIDKMVSIKAKMDYEYAIVAKIVKEAKDEGLEF